jgi:hypothetical protein
MAEHPRVTLSKIDMNIPSVHIFREEIIKYRLMDDSQWEAMFKLAAGDAGQQRIDSWLQDMRLTGEVRVGVVGFMNMDEHKLTACAKVMVLSTERKQYVAFVHEEPYLSFPSDEFKTKILLVAG